MAVRIKTPLLCSLFLLGSCGLFGQYLVNPVGRDVLPEVESLHYLSQTPDGRYWATSSKSIICFDGALGRLFPIQDPGRKVQLGEYPQSPMMEASDGRLWITTYKALHVFDPIKETFRSYQLSEDAKVLDRDYRLLQIDSTNGEALLRAGDYLWTYQTLTGEYRKVAGPTQGTKFAALGKDAWAAVSYDDTLEIFHRLPNGVTFEREDFILPSRLLAITSKDESTLWLATDLGLARLQLPFVDTETSFQLVAPKGGAKAILCHTDGSIWSTSRDTGVYRYDPILGKVTDVITPSTGLRGANPQYLSEDRYGRIWVAQYGQGFDVVIKQSENFFPLSLVHDRPVSDLHTPDGQYVLVGDRRGKIQRITGATRATPAVAGLPSQHDGSHRAAKMKFTESDQQVWVGNQRQLGRYDPNKGDFTWYNRPVNPYCDFYRSGDGLLVVISQRGVMSVQPDGDSIRLQPLLPFPPSDGLRYTGLFGLTDSTFLIWERGSEIWPCTVRNGAVTIDARLPVNGWVNAALYWQNRIFIATNSGLMEASNDTIITILGEDSQGRTPRVMSIIADRQTKELWLGTTNGLLRYNPISGKQTHFGVAEGLPDQEFLPADPAQLDDGTIWMATKSGIIRFHPDSLTIHKETLTPYVAGLWVNDIVQTKELIGRNLTRVEREYQQNSLSFRLGMVGLLPAGEGMVEYQLSDYDLAPIRVARNEVIRYPQLPAGEYQLKLTAIDGRGERSKMKTIDIMINPSFWATIWFRLAVMLFLSLIATLVYTYLLQRERYKQTEIREREALISAERDRIAGEVHDDLGGQLSSIMFLSEELLLTKAAPSLGYELGRINQLSQHSLHNIRDIIFALDNRRATVADLSDQVKTAGEELFRDHHLTFSFNGHCTRGERPLNSRQKRNLFSIVREAWHNTIKHAHANKVTMNFDCGEKILTIIIADDGRGLPQKLPKKTTGGYGLGNIKTKAEAIGGTLTVASQPGEGTHLTLWIPLT